MVVLFFLLGNVIFAQEAKEEIALIIEQAKRNIKMVEEEYKEEYKAEQVKPEELSGEEIREEKTTQQIILSSETKSLLLQKK